MKLKIIDGYNGGVAHISASMIRDHNISMYGTGDFVLPLGNQFAHEIVNNNNIKIKDGIGVIGGARFVIEYGQTETVTIENGTSGYKRNDIIVAEYEKNSTTLVESVTLKVVKGAIGSTGSDPALSQGNIRAGATVRQMPLYRIKLNGLTIESVEKMWTAFVTPIEKGGTGAATVAGARNALGLGNTSGAVPVANGGTGAATAAAARANLGLTGAETKTLLWTNASSESSFAAQPISLNLRGYDSFAVVYKMSASNSQQYFEERCLLGRRLTASALYTATSFVYRFIDSSESGIYVGAPAGATTDTSYIIPYKIYGIKGV